LLANMRDLAEILVRPLADELTRAGVQWTDDWLTEEGAAALPNENDRAIARYGRRMFVVCRDRRR
jgi:hypothetical protein